MDWDGFDLIDLGELEFRDEAADPTADGRFRRSGDELTWRTQDGRTNTVTRNFALWSDTTGAPAASIGIGLLFQAESADENPSDFGALDWIATDVTAASEDTVLDVLARVAGAALTAIYRLEATGAFRATLTHALTAARTITFQDVTGTIYVSGGTDVTLADGGTGASLVDPNADRIMFWDDSAGVVDWLTAGSGLTIAGTTMTAGGGLSRIGGSNTEVTSTSTNLADGQTFTSVSIPTTSGIWITGRIRKTSGAAAAVTIGVVLNTTEMTGVAGFSVTNTTNEANFASFEFLIPPLGDTTYTGMLFRAVDAVNGTQWINAANILRPNATITTVTIRIRSENALVTVGQNYARVYAYE